MSALLTLHLPKLLHGWPSLGLGALAPAALAGAAAAVGQQLRRASGSPSAAGVAGIGCTASGAATAGSETAEDLGDLRPDMTLSEEELDEADHYAVRAHVHRRRLRPQPEERHLDEEDPPGEEAPGEEAYKEAGPLLPPDSEEEDILSDAELEARK